MLPLLVSVLVTAISLFIISKLPIGIEIDSFPKAIIAAIAFGIINGILHFFATPLEWITFGLFAIVVNIIAFGLAAAAVEGFRLRHGIWSAIVGSFALGFVNSLIDKFLSTVVG